MSLLPQDLRALLQMHVQKLHHKELTQLRKKTEELSLQVMRWEDTAVSLQCKVAEIEMAKDARKRNKVSLTLLYVLEE